MIEILYPSRIWIDRLHAAYNLLETAVPPPNWKQREMYAVLPNGRRLK